MKKLLRSRALALLLLPAFSARSAAQLPTDIVFVSPLPHPSFPYPDYWGPDELTQDGWVLMGKWSDPVLGRQTELWKPFVGTIPLHSVTPGFELSVVYSAVDDPVCRPGLVYVCGMLQALADPEKFRGFVYEVETDSGRIRSLVEAGMLITRYQPSDGSYYRINGANPGGLPPFDNELVGVPPLPLPRGWSPIGGVGSRFGWACLASNYASGERSAWTFSNAAGSWTEVPVPNCDEVVDLSDDGLLVVRELLAPGQVRYHSVAADGSVRSYPILDQYEAANSHGLVLERQQVFEHSTGAATAFPLPLNLLDMNDRGIVVGTDGYWQLIPTTPLPPADCSHHVR